MIKMKTTSQYLCSECGETFSKWMGKCSSCNSWNTINEFKESKINAKGKSSVRGIDLLTLKNENKSTIKNHAHQRISTNITEVDRVLGDGFFPGSLILFGGSPGVGKSSLSLQVFANVEGAFYFSGEESREQVLSRAKRMFPDVSHEIQNQSNIFATNSLEDLFETISKNKPVFVVVDSIQTISSESSSFGQVSQIRENAEALLKLSKSTGTSILVIGHVTKSDEIAGPKMLEHLVDAVLYLEGEKSSEIRILRSTKNRFGSTQEVGIFEMTGSGLKELKNPSEFFLSERADNAFGSVVSVVREGARNFLIEIQALTVKTNFGFPRRTAHGTDLSKLHLLLAVISKFTPFKCEASDVYLNVVGGLRIHEPSTDLAICSAILSSFVQKEVPADTIVLGEVGLSGEVRHVAALETRLREADKLGFRKAITPPLKSVSAPKKLEVVEVRSVKELMSELF